MRIKLIILIFIIFSFLLFGQVPEWQWATRSGGSDWDEGNGIALDIYENSFITGNFCDISIFGSDSLISTGNSDIFVAKLDVNGNYLCASQAGGSGYDNGKEIAMDNFGNGFVTGDFSYTAAFGNHSITSSGYSDVYVAKIDANGTWLWVKNAGGNAADKGYGIVIDNNTNCLVSGYFKDTANFGTHSLTSDGDRDIFIAKIDANGNWLWAAKAGGNTMDIGSKITIDENGNGYLTGCFSNTATFGSHSLTSSGGFDIFVAKIDTNGNWLWATKAGGNDIDVGIGITLDNIGNVYITGYFSGTVLFDDYLITSSGNQDMFVAKMDVNGNWSWITQAGGNDNDEARGQEIEIDDFGNCYVTGYVFGTTSFGSINLINDGSYVAKIDASGSWVWAIVTSGSGINKGQGIAIDNIGNCYITGYFSDTVAFGTYALTSTGYIDLYVARLGINTLIENDMTPLEMELSNFPNPFNPETKIVFNLPKIGEIQLDIYNIKGQKIKSLLDDQITAGEHSIVWNGEDASGKKVGSGVYLYKLIVDDKTEAVKKCLLLK